jgi:hypothetical protein
MFKNSIFVIFSLLSFQAFGMTYYLQQDLGVKGNMRYCKYSNGSTYTFNATDLCEISIEEGSSTRNTKGFLKGEYQDGMTKVCVYDVLGEKRAARVDSVALCPLSQDF